MSSWSDWRVVLKYRFIGPRTHSGIHANYYARLRRADAVILTQADAALYFSRWHPPDTTGDIECRFVR